MNFNKNDIIIDFAGSGTTADAVLKYNVSNNNCIKYIMTQLPRKLLKVAH